MMFGLFLVLLGAMVVVGLAQEPVESILKRAPTAVPGEDGAYMLDEGTRTLLPDGTSTLVMHHCLRLFTQDGVKGYGEVQVPYDSDYQEIHLDYARTITADGREVIPDKSAIREMPLSALKGTPTYSRFKMYTILMPALTPGAIIDYQVTIKDKTFASSEEHHGFSDIWYFEPYLPGLPVQTSRYVVRVPAVSHLRWQVEGTELTPTVQTDSDTVTYTFVKNDIPPSRDWVGGVASMLPLGSFAPVEVMTIGAPFLVFPEIPTPFVVVSTFSSWDEVASWDNDLLFANQCQTDSKIVAKVQELTDGIQIPSGKISAIYDFVARKVRSADQETSPLIEPCPPRSASRTFLSSSGYPAEKVILLITMLREAGFEAYPALLQPGRGTDYVLSLPPNVQVLNDIIAAVRQGSKWLFLDPTCDACTASYLPYYERDRDVMILLGKKDQSYLLTTTYPSDPDKNYVKSAVDAVFSPEGDLKATVKISTGGDYDVFYRDFLLAYQKGENKGQSEKQIFELLPGLSVSSAKLISVDYSDLNDVNTPVTLTEKFSKSRFAVKTTSMLLIHMPYLGLLLGSDMFPVFTGWKYPLMNVPLLRVQRATITLPGGEMSVKLPADEAVTNEVGSFSSHYAYADGKIRFTRTLRIVANKILPDQYPLIKAINDAMVSDANVRIVAKPGS